MSKHTWHEKRRGVVRATALGLLIWAAAAGVATAQEDQMVFPATTDTVSMIVDRINAETVRLDISAWYLTEHAITNAIIARFNAGVPVRVIGDRGSIFEIDPSTKREFYYLANAGVPIRLRYNPTWYPEIDHWKAAIFKSQGLVEFGSANWSTYELKPASLTNYSDETVMFTKDPTLVGAFLAKFDIIWNDTTREPESQYGAPPYLKNWWDVCAVEAGCMSGFQSLFPNGPARQMVIDTSRQENDAYMPPDLIWGQGPSFNNRLVTEINNENGPIRFVIYRLTVPNITNALLNKSKAGVPVRLIIEPNEYLNRKWPEFWLSHASIDQLWAAGVQIRERAHTGLTHMKMLVTSRYATNASSNYAAAWQRDHNYFVSAADKPTIYQAMSDRFDTMWNDINGTTPGFRDFVPRAADAPALDGPSNGATSVASTPTLSWARAPFATSYDVYISTSPSNLLQPVATVAAELSNDPPKVYSWTPTLSGGTTYYWKVVSRTFAGLSSPSDVWTFTTGGSSGTPPPPPPPSGSNVPAPWANRDIGNVGIAGSATYSSSSNSFTVNGSGSDIWGTSDSFQYVYQPISTTGDFQIVARVTSEQNTNTYAKAGIMLRESLSSNAAHVILDMKPGGGVEFMTRSTSGGSTSWLAGANSGFPVWLKLTRSGSTVIGYVSSDGSSWAPLGNATLSTGAYAGLVVTSHNTSLLNTSTFDNVVVGASSPPPPPSTALPSPWQERDVGNVGVTGSASFSNPVFTVKGAGADIWGNADSFHYVYKTLSGDGQLTVRVTSEQNTNTYAKAGIVLRETLDPGAKSVIVDVTPSGNVEFMTRSTTGGQTNWLSGASQGFPVWLRLVRAGSIVTGYVSADGSSWRQVGTTNVTIGTSAFIGLAVTSHNTSVLNTATFDSVQ